MYTKRRNRKRGVSIYIHFYHLYLQLCTLRKTKIRWTIVPAYFTLSVQFLDVFSILLLLLEIKLLPINCDIVRNNDPTKLSIVLLNSMWPITNRICYVVV